MTMGKTHARSSAGMAGRFATVALIGGLALILLAGAFAADVLVRPEPQTSTTSSAPTSTTQASYLTTSSSETAGTLTSTASQSTASTSTTQSAATTATSGGATSATSSHSAQAGAVQILLPEDVGVNESLNFAPSKVTVVIGVNNTIVWNDLDYVQHTVQSVAVPGGAKPWKSGILNEGQTFSVVLTVPGTYRYDCSIHPDWMVGTINVVA